MSAAHDAVPDATPTTEPELDVVLVGNDIGSYALARAFHERYRIRPTLVTRVLTGAVQHSSILNYAIPTDTGGREVILAELERIGAERAARGIRPILLANTDSWVSYFTEHADTLTRWYDFPVVPREVLDLISDKISFDEICRELDIPSPRTLIADFRDADHHADDDNTDWILGEFDLPFPVVAKAALSSEYELLQFPGKEKVYKVDTPAELTEILHRVKAAGFRDRFVIQELIPGDDSTVRSITAYMDRSGTATLLATAQVLLQEHTPLLVGNPAAMVTTPYPELMDQAERLLRRVGYHGFANFDVKVDPRDGVAKFFEMNPRIGRNNYYVTAAGANVAEFIVDDLVHGISREPVHVTRQVLYTVLPLRLVRKYLDDEHRDLLRRVSRTGGVHHPMGNRDGWRRLGYRLTSLANHVRKFRQYYPEPTDTGF